MSYRECSPRVTCPLSKTLKQLFPKGNRQYSAIHSCRACTCTWRVDLRKPLVGKGYCPCCWGWKTRYKVSKPKKEQKKEPKRKKLKGAILELFQKMDNEGGLIDFIHWGGLEDEISLAVKKEDPALYQFMLSVKEGVKNFDLWLEQQYEDYTGTEGD